MDSKDDEFLKRIHATFQIEAQEHLNAFSAGLIEIEKPQNQEKLNEIIEVMFREIHSLKGAARSIDQKEIESMCQPLESVFFALKRKEIKLCTSYFDLFYKVVERLAKIITDSGLKLPFADRQIHRELIRELKEITEGISIKSNTNEPLTSKESKLVEYLQVDSVENESETGIEKTAKTLLQEVVRVKISKLDPLLLQAEEMIQAKKAINQRIHELKQINTWTNEWKLESMRWNVHRSIVSFALWNDWIEGNETRLIKLESQLSELASSLERDKYSLDGMVDNHLEGMRQILMLPVSSIVEAFPGMVREIAREQNKRIDFIVRDAEMEVDKRILEELKDPLIHLIRNSIDHGIEKPEERISQHKPANGRITLAFAAKEGGQFEITLSDDGKGIDKNTVLMEAIKSGILSQEAAERMNPKEILSLIYQSGFSTSSIVTDMSGRGLGLSIVREKIEKLNGIISLETEVNVGTTFHILLPMTLTTFRGIVVKVKEHRFIIPTMNVERVLKIDNRKIRTVNNIDTIQIGGQILSIADLGEVLGLPEHKHVSTYESESGITGLNQLRVVVLVSGAQRIAIKVDEVLDEQQVLVKSLGKLLNRVRNISGATILGSGKVVPVLHIGDLIKSALRPIVKDNEQHSLQKIVAKRKKILVTDDSITSRTLIKNILETAGYKVSTAVDGADAFTKACSNEFDLIVSDVDMPRMSGFELTAKIRSDKKLSSMPVILLTALGSDEDRERGIEVRADAYLIKKNFDQNNLLEVIGKII
jgi:two-component system, chemotaxis family, sensor kinase CheA